MATHYTIDDLKNVYGNGMCYYSETSGLETHEYYCFPEQPGDLITSKTWKIQKIITITTTGVFQQGKCITWADGSPDFNHYATSLAVVKTYTYS